MVCLFVLVLAENVSPKIDMNKIEGIRMFVFLVFAFFIASVK